jgi:hypothetical protein
MARQQRSTTFTQESTRPIAQVALYARVSTLNNQDPEMQLTELREYAGRRGWQIVEEFTDQGVSGSKESRPALNRLMADACRRRFDAVLVWKIDRFGRSLSYVPLTLSSFRLADDPPTNPMRHHLGSNWQKAESPSIAQPQLGNISGSAASEVNMQR